MQSYPASFEQPAGQHLRVATSSKSVETDNHNIEEAN